MNETSRPKNTTRRTRGSTRGPWSARDLPRHAAMDRGSHRKTVDETTTIRSGPQPMISVRIPAPPCCDSRLSDTSRWTEEPEQRRMKTRSRSAGIRRSRAILREPTRNTFGDGQSQIGRKTSRKLDELGRGVKRPLGFLELALFSAVFSFTPAVPAGGRAARGRRPSGVAGSPKVRSTPLAAGVPMPAPAGFRPPDSMAAVRPAPGGVRLERLPFRSFG